MTFLDDGGMATQSGREPAITVPHKQGFSSKSNRNRLGSMGSLMDTDDDENQMENRPPKNRRASSNSQRQAIHQGAQQHPGPPRNDENANNNNPEAMAQSMIRQHRRRLMTGGQVATSVLIPHHNTIAARTAGGVLANINLNQPAWDGFVRKGTQLKSFLDEALQHVATGYSVANEKGTKRQRVAEEPDESGEPLHVREREEATAKFAKEKTTEVTLLRQKFEEAQAQVAALKASNQTLREESTASSLRFERTIEALKISAANAASARTDADQAEVSAECLATQLEALKTVVEQTKQAAQVLHDEQEEISEQARIGQAKLLKVQAELARSQKESRSLREKAKEWQSTAKDLHEESATLKRQLADEAEKSRKLTKALEERDVLEEARKKRSQQVEKELQQAQALLLEASSAAADSDVIANINESLAKLQEANKKLHEQLEEQQENAHEEKERLRESLLVAEKEAQALRIEASLKSDQDIGQQPCSNSSDKSASTPEAGGNLKDLDTSFSISSTALNNISTPESATGNNDKHVVPPAANCCICFKAAFGLMKSCQCGRAECDKRAHLTCANRINPGPSVSHPGTPAAKLPIVLCSGALAGIIKP